MVLVPVFEPSCDCFVQCIVSSSGGLWLSFLLSTKRRSFLTAAWNLNLSVRCVYAEPHRLRLIRNWVGHFYQSWLRHKESPSVLYSLRYIAFVSPLMLLKFVFYFLTPVVSIGVVYGLMARHLLFSGSFLPPTAEAEQQPQEDVKTQKSVAKVVLVIVLVFVLCFLPKHIFLIWFYGNLPDSMEQYHLGGISSSWSFSCWPSSTPASLHWRCTLVLVKVKIKTSLRK